MIEPLKLGPGSQLSQLLGVCYCGLVQCLLTWLQVRWALISLAEPTSLVPLMPACSGLVPSLHGEEQTGLEGIRVAECRLDNQDLGVLLYLRLREHELFSAWLSDCGLPQDNTFLSAVKVEFPHPPCLWFTTDTQLPKEGMGRDGH